jgi:hypothetical protein
MNSISTTALESTSTEANAQVPAVAEMALDDMDMVGGGQCVPALW